MGWLVANVVLPIVFAVVATCLVLKLALLLVRLVFTPVLALRRVA